MVSVLNYETAGSHSYLLEVWGDVVHKTRPQTRQQATQWRVSQAIAREKDQQHDNNTQWQATSHQRV
jgi:hypothetical protein